MAKKIAVDKYEKERTAIIDYFNGSAGLNSFKKIIKENIRDKNQCPLRDQCYAHFAKSHDDDHPNFFINPCWEIKKESCICPVRNQEGCDNCPRKKENNPLC